MDLLQNFVDKFVKIVGVSFMIFKKVLKAFKYEIGNTDRMNKLFRKIYLKISYKLRLDPLNSHYKLSPHPF